MPVQDCALAAPGCLKGMSFHLQRQAKTYLVPRPGDLLFEI